MRRYALIVLLFVALSANACSLPKISLFPEAGPLKETTLQGSGEEKILVVSVNGVISDQPRERMLRSSPGMVEEIVSHLNGRKKIPISKRCSSRSIRRGDRSRPAISSIMKSAPTRRKQA